VTASPPGELIDGLRAVAVGKGRKNMRELEVENLAISGHRTVEARRFNLNRIAVEASPNPNEVEALLNQTTLGRGSCIAHHGEILQGSFYNEKGIVQRGSVTLRCPLFSASAKFLPTRQSKIEVYPNRRTKRKAIRAAQLTLAKLRKQHLGGLLFLAADSPEGWGLGSSTSDVVATIRAVADAFRTSFTAGDIALLAVEAEVASDSIMFDRDVVLFAHRDGIVLETFDNSLPPLDVLGFDTDPTHSGVDTLLHPPAAYTWQEIESFRPLRGLLRRAIADQDPRAVGAVATASARINERFLPKPRFSEILRVKEDSGALGVQVAHSGSVVGLMFDATDGQKFKAIARAVTSLHQLGFPACHRFSTESVRHEIA
jgi:uncharacterized protein involved in propanediol utilization